MIFVSVGSQMPFDRLIRAVDEWARRHPDTSVFAQIGLGAYEPRHAQWARVMPWDDYARRLGQCSLFIAHVGMGSILQALEQGTPMLLLPRRHALGEHRNDHQLDTAARFTGQHGIRIVADTGDLAPAIDACLGRGAVSGSAITDCASDELLMAVASFLSDA